MARPKIRVKKKNASIFAYEADIELIKKAAWLESENMSEFIIKAALKRARRILRELDKTEKKGE